MPFRLFEDLNEEKKLKIIDAALLEFSQFSYNDSSTNNIVKNAGISKGSLFKYFSNKEDLYFYILDKVIMDMIGDLTREIDILPKDIVERVMVYCELEISWYLENPIKYHLIKKAFKDNSSHIYKKTIEKYGDVGEAFYYKLFDDVVCDDLQWDKRRTSNVLKWFLKSFNEEFTQKKEEDIAQLKASYLNSLKEYLEILKVGLYK